MCVVVVFFFHPLQLVVYSHPSHHVLGPGPISHNVAYHICDIPAIIRFWYV